MTTGRRKWLKRKWEFAAGNVQTAQEHLLEARVYYVERDPKHVELVDNCMTMLEITKTFLIEARSKI